MTRVMRDSDGREGDRGDEDRTDPRSIHDQLRQAAIDLATAQVLDRRADGSASPALAELLRERARVRRQRAARLRRLAVTPRSRT
jgi:hypothetical protein